MSRTFRIWPGYYDVVILPSEAIRDHAIQLSQQLFRSGGLWKLGRRAFLPHISLYHIPVTSGDLEGFLNELRRVVDAAQFGFLETTGLDMPVMTVSKPHWLKNLQRQVVHRTVRYFNREYGAEAMWSLHRFSGRRLEFAARYLREYGSPMIGMNFRPHITLSSFKGEDPADLHIQIQHMRFHVDRLYVCELGISHSCQRIIQEIPLPTGEGWVEGSK